MAQVKASIEHLVGPFVLFLVVLMKGWGVLVVEGDPLSLGRLEYLPSGGSPSNAGALSGSPKP